MFYLPFRTQGEHSRATASAELAKQFRSDMQPETVLFLRKLSMLCLFFPDGKDGNMTSVIYRRNIDPQNKIDVEVEKTITLYKPIIGQPDLGLQKHSTNRETSLYKRGECEYAVPPESREQRRNYERTSIMLAFPTNEDGQPNIDRKNAVFAFLPVRSFGFRFVIQADFLLVANREDIIKENVWNEFLREMLPTTFLRLFPALKLQADLGTHHVRLRHERIAACGLRQRIQLTE